jgi:hypothetical protein
MVPMRTVNTDANDWNGRGRGTQSEMGGAPWDFVSRVADRLSKGRKAVPMTEGLIAANVVENPGKLRRITNENEPVLNRYFEQLDVRALADRLGVEETIQSRSAEVGKSLLLAAAGAVAVKGFEYFASQ